jgi:hypothetical protein
MIKRKTRILAFVSNEQLIHDELLEGLSFAAARNIKLKRK